MNSISVLSLGLVLASLTAIAETHSNGRLNAQNPSMEHEDSFPTVEKKHLHARKLLANAMLFVSDDTIDPTSGYIAEGWNNDENASLRGFTQLTAIGEWMELLAEVMVGHAKSPYLDKQRAFELLKKVTQSLLHDQKDSNVARRGLLVNFMLMKPDGRFATPIHELERGQFLKVFGAEVGQKLWRALLDKGWLKEGGFGFDASIDRQKDISLKAFLKTFDPALAPYAEKVLELLNQRSVSVVFGDNANLTTSVAKTIGALSRSPLSKNVLVRDLMNDMEQFLENQKPGYEDMYHKDAGLFYFGKETYIGSDPTEERTLGSRNPDGTRKPMHSDYLVNEFRGPTAFVISRYGLPLDPLKNMGFRQKSYQMSDGRRLHTLSPWDGSAFQGLGLSLSMTELHRPSFKKNLKDFVEIEVDHSRRMGFPGLATEAYRGPGDYTGRQGIPEIAADDMAEGTKTPALYPLGVAYQVDPNRMEKFFADHSRVFDDKLLTDHGPWEGLNVETQQPVKIQTSAHTFSLALGLIGTGLDNMDRYLGEKGLTSKIGRLFPVGKRQVWNETHLQPLETKTVLSSSDPNGISVSGGTFKLKYRTNQALNNISVRFFPVDEKSSVPLLPKELVLQVPNSGGRDSEIEIPFPAIPGLHGLKKIEINAKSVDLKVTGAEFSPLQK